MTFGFADAIKVYFPHSDNLAIYLNVGKCILGRVLIIAVVDVSILYARVFKETRLLIFMLSMPLSVLKLFTDDLSSTMGIICLPIKIDHHGKGYILTDKIYFIIKVKSKYNAVMSIEWQHNIGVVHPLIKRS